MYKIALLASMTLLLTAVATAQIPTSGNIFVGYSYNHVDSLVPATSDSANMNGWEGSLEGKLFPFVGIVADISGYYGSQTVFSCPPGGGSCGVNVDGKIHSFLFGPRVSVPLGRFTPFAHGLVGLSHVSDNFSVAGSSESDTSFAYAIGGGIDYKLIPALAWRFQGDFLQTRFFSDKQNDVRFSTGIVFRF